MFSLRQVVSLLSDKVMMCLQDDRQTKDDDAAPFQIFTDVTESETSTKRADPVPQPFTIFQDGQASTVVEVCEDFGIMFFIIFAMPCSTRDLLYKG